MFRKVEYKIEDDDNRKEKLKKYRKKNFEKKVEMDDWVKLGYFSWKDYMVDKLNGEI